MSAPDVFDRILGQPQVRHFLRAQVAAQCIGQSYLFCGPAGSNKTAAAYALAQAALCEKGGCGTCSTCEKIRRRNHPDVRYIAPEGAAGYLVGQIRDITSDVDRAPIQAQRKAYIIDRVDLMNASAANAFLKTLEEPPQHVVLILLGRTREAVLPTIVSRCQVVPFRHIPAHEACGIISQNTGVPPTRAAVALAACDGSISRAIEFAKSTERFAFRQRVLDVMESLPLADDLDIIQYASELLDAAKAPLDLVRASQERDLAASSEFLAKSAIRQIEARNKRALTARTTESLRQTTAIMRSWLRDVLAATAGAGATIVNEDRRAGIEAAALRVKPAALVRALRAHARCDEAIRYNVSPETCIDVLLLQIREELYGSHSAGGVAI